MKALIARRTNKGPFSLQSCVVIKKLSYFPASYRLKKLRMPPRRRARLTGRCTRRLEKGIHCQGMLIQVTIMGFYLRRWKLPRTLHTRKETSPGSGKPQDRGPGPGGLVRRPRRLCPRREQVVQSLRQLSSTGLLSQKILNPFCSLI
jgi:hypothetical protein